MQANPLRTLLRLKRGTVAFVLAALAATAVVFISETAYWESTRAMGRLDAMITAHSDLLNLSRRVVDAESGQRVDAALFGHRQVQQQHVDVALAYQVERFAAVRRLASDLQVDLVGKVLAQARTHNRVIVDDGDSDHGVDSTVAS